MRKWLPLLALCGAVAGAAAPVRAATLPFTATLSVSVGMFSPVTATGSGSGSSDGVGFGATIPSGVFSVGATAAISPPLLNLVGGFAVCAQGLPSATLLTIPPSGLGSCDPSASGTLGALAFDGAMGTASLLASAYLTGLVDAMSIGMTVAAVPLTAVGQGGTAAFSAFGGLVAGTVTGNPWQLGAVTATGVLSGAGTTLTGAGFDARNASGAGTLQLITVTNADLGIGNLPALAVLTISFIPEPGTLLLLGAGIAGIAALGRRRTRR